MVGAALGWAVLTGCLLPQEETFLDPEPLQRNRPLRILEEQVVPAARFNTVGPESPCLLRFQFNVEDPDVDDAIEVEWYVDDSPVSNPVRVREQAIPTNDRPVRSESASFEININSPGSPISSAALYSVEAVVADGPLVDREVLPRKLPAPDGGVVEDPTYTDSVTWLVDVLTLNCEQGGLP